MDRAVLDAYGWSDVSTACELLLDYAIDEAAYGRKKERTLPPPATFSAVASDGTSSRLEMRRRFTPSGGIIRAE